MPLTEAQKRAQAKYAKTDKGRACRRRYLERYYQTDKGRAYLERHGKKQTECLICKEWFHKANRKLCETCKAKACVRCRRALARPNKKMCQECADGVSTYQVHRNLKLGITKRTIATIRAESAKKQKTTNQKFRPKHLPMASEGYAATNKIKPKERKVMEDILSSYRNY